MKNFSTLLLLLIGLLPGLGAQSLAPLPVTLQWETAPQTVKTEDATAVLFHAYRFAGSVMDDGHPERPVFRRRIALPTNGRFGVRLTNPVYEAFEPEDAERWADLPEAIEPATAVEGDRDRYYGVVTFVPVRRTGGRYERLVSFELEPRLTAQPLPQSRNGFTQQSVLADGEVFQVAVTESGVHKLTYAFLKDELGMPLDGIDPRQLRLYGNGGGIVPETVVPLDAYVDDLQENRIRVVGEEDGSFDAGDYVLFYAQGPTVWTYDADGDRFDRTINPYDQRNYYYLKAGGGNGLRVEAAPALTGAQSTDSYDAHYREERETVNLLREWVSGEGSGRRFYGDLFKGINEKTYTDFTVPDLISDVPAEIEVAFAVRSKTQGNTKVRIDVDGQTKTLPGSYAITGGTATQVYARRNVSSTTVNLQRENPEITVTHVRSNDGTEGWLDYLQLTARRALRMTGTQFRFRDRATIDAPSVDYRLSATPAQTTVWDITDALRPQAMATMVDGDALRFGAPAAGTLREFVAFDPGAALLGAEAIGALENQNLHGLRDLDMVIIYHEAVREEAERLAQHRRDYDGYAVATVLIEDVYHEFSSGRRDASAVRDFARMLHQPDRGGNFRYLLLFGDGSFDNRDLYREEGDPQNNFLPVFETYNSENPILAYPADDYFGLLSVGEGGGGQTGALDIGVGRLPVSTAEQAREVVDKLISYDASKAAYGDWRNRVVFLGDDGDGGLHTRDAETVADDIRSQFPAYNQDKIYLDAFEQVATPGGTRVPAATESLNRNIFRGAVAITYLGHGGSSGWAQERVLKIEDVNGWNNADQLPVFITATCTFAGYDDPDLTTAGEAIMLRPGGGAVALLTTVRAVYASSNKVLTQNSLDEFFKREADGRAQTLGEIIRKGKNATSSSSANVRKFTLLGDPAQRVALPRYGVRTTRINGQAAGGTQLDTLRALQKVTIEGEVVGEDGQRLTDFNGTLFPTIFDKAAELQTRGNRAGNPVIGFDLRKSRVFKGKATVTNGSFTFTFVVPKDINFDFGTGKLSYYAATENETTTRDAGGASFDFVIGGIDENALADDRGPEVEVFMNTEDFVFGGLTGDSPTLLVKLADDNGINVVGNSIGHDLTGVLDEQTQNTYLLNDFYEAEQDDYTKGTVRYPLSKLAEGRHQIRVRAWDVANNQSEGYTEFIVAGDGKLALEHVLNYPNPFTTNTCFQFEHGTDVGDLDVRVQIFTVSGRLIKTLNERINAPGSRLGLGNCLRWDGRDDYGDQLAKGVYLYRVQVKAVGAGDELTGESDFEKLVILK